MLDENINIVRKNTEALSEASRVTGQEVNTEKIEYIIVSRHQNAERSHNVLLANESFENVANFKYLRTIVTNQNYLHEEIKSRLNSGNACCHSVQPLVFRSPL
jgi:hypothetical protein